MTEYVPNKIVEMQLQYIKTNANKYVILENLPTADDLVTNDVLFSTTTLPSLTIDYRAGSTVDRQLSVASIGRCTITKTGTARAIALVDSSDDILWSVELQNAVSVTKDAVLEIGGDEIEARIGQ